MPGYQALNPAADGQRNAITQALMNVQNPPPRPQMPPSMQMPQQPPQMPQSRPQMQMPQMPPPGAPSQGHPCRRRHRT